MRIGILSDTHGSIPEQVYSFFKDCDELWHAGDIGPNVIEHLRDFKPLVAVFGNIDGWDLRSELPQVQTFIRERNKILMTHIGGYPNHYDAHILPLIESEKPDIFVAGHSHILRIMYDTKHRLLHLNPGAAGYLGFHKNGTLIRFILDSRPRNVEICEFPKYPNYKSPNT